MQEAYQQLQTSLKQSIEHLEFILDCLHQEREAMVASNHDLLLELVERKIQRIDELSDLDQVLTNILLENTQQASMSTFLAMQNSHDDRKSLDALKVLWEYYMALLRTCRDKNMINGNVVNLRMQRLRQEYRLLTQGGDEMPASYNAAGQMQSVTAVDPEMVV